MILIFYSSLGIPKFHHLLLQTRYDYTNHLGDGRKEIGSNYADITSSSYGLNVIILCSYIFSYDSVSLTAPRRPTVKMILCFLYVACINKVDRQKVDCIFLDGIDPVLNIKVDRFSRELIATIFERPNYSIERTIKVAIIGFMIDLYRMYILHTFDLLTT